MVPPAEGTVKLLDAVDLHVSVVNMYTLNSYLLVICHVCLHLVTSNTIPRCPDLVHFGHPLLELVVLALLIAVSFVLLLLQQPHLVRMRLAFTYHTFPWQVKFFVAALVQWYEEVRAAISVSQRKFRI